MKKDYILRNGLVVPAIGFGTYKISDDKEGEDILVDALRAGYRLIDTATMYGNEKMIGRAIRRADEEGVAKRADVRLTTKVANEDRGYDSTLRAFERSEKSLGSNIDIYLIHWPLSEGIASNWRKVNSETWRAMERLLTEKRVKAIGVSNFKARHLEALAETAEVLPMMNQIEFHPGWMEPETLCWCQNHGVLVEGWSPLGRTRMFDHALLRGLAEKYGRSVAQICLRWALQHGVAPIPKTTSPVRMQENLDIYDFSISEADMETIDNMGIAGESGLDPDTITF